MIRFVVNEETPGFPISIWLQLCQKQIVTHQGISNQGNYLTLLSKLKLWSGATICIVWSTRFAKEYQDLLKVTKFTLAYHIKFTNVYTKLGQFALVMGGM